MLNDFKRIAIRAEGVAGDAIGAVALMVIFVTALHMPILV